MTKSEMMPWLVKWSEKIQAADDALDSIQRIFYGDFEAPAIKPFCNLMTAYTVAIGEIVGDEWGWLEYYQYECQMGKRTDPHKIICANGEVHMASLDALADVLRTDHDNGHKPG